MNEPSCVQLLVYVREKPTVRTIDYKGLNAISTSDVLDRFKKEKSGLTIESQYDPTKVKRAEVVLQEMPRRAWPPVRHHQDRGQDHSPRPSP